MADLQGCLNFRGDRQRPMKPANLLHANRGAKGFTVKRLIVASFSALFVLSLAACGGDDDDDKAGNSSSLPSNDDVSIPDVSIPDLSLPPGVSIPDLSIPPGLSIPDLSIPSSGEVTDTMIDNVVTMIEQAGITVDRDCVADVVEGIDVAVLADQAEVMGPEFIQQFVACVVA
jgi:hypothetical protein